MRKETRFKIRCPVTVRFSNGPNRKTEVKGMVCDIGVDGARLELEQPIPVGTKTDLFVHFKAPDGEEITIRFEGVVERLRDQPRWDVAVQFRGTGRFLQRKLRNLDGAKRGNPGDCPEGSHHCKEPGNVSHC